MKVENIQISQFFTVFTARIWWQNKEFMERLKWARACACVCVCIRACVAVTVCGSAPGLAEREQISTLAGLELNEELCLRGCCHFQRAPLPIITGHLSTSLAKIKRSLRLNSLRKCWYFWIAFIIRTGCKLPTHHQGPSWDPFHFFIFCIFAPRIAMQISAELQKTPFDKALRL